MDMMQYLRLKPTMPTHQVSSLQMKAWVMYTMLQEEAAQFLVQMANSLAQMGNMNLVLTEQAVDLLLVTNLEP